MVRTYKKKRTKPEVSEEVIEKAMEAVRNAHLYEQQQIYMEWTFQLYFID